MHVHSYGSRPLRIVARENFHKANARIALRIAKGSRQSSVLSQNWRLRAGSNYLTLNRKVVLERNGSSGVRITDGNDAWLGLSG